MSKGSREQPMESAAIAALTQRISQLSHEKDAAVQQADYFRAAQLRDEAELVRRQIADLRATGG